MLGSPGSKWTWGPSVHSETGSQSTVLWVHFGRGDLSLSTEALVFVYCVSPAALVFLKPEMSSYSVNSKRAFNTSHTAISVQGWLFGRGRKAYPRPICCTGCTLTSLIISVSCFWHIWTYARKCDITWLNTVFRLQVVGSRLATLVLATNVVD